MEKTYTMNQGMLNHADHCKISKGLDTSMKLTNMGTNISIVIPSQFFDLLGRVKEDAIKAYNMARMVTLGSNVQDLVASLNLENPSDVKTLEYFSKCRLG